VPMNISETAPIALVGSGEFLPQMAEVDRLLLRGRPMRAAFLPTAAGQEGEASIDHWLSLGTKHYKSIGVEPIAIPVLNRDDANDPEFVKQLDGVGLIYLSGGNPGYLANTLRDTLMWSAIESAWHAGVALAGCSAGAMALSANAPIINGGSFVPVAGLRLVPHLSVIPHFDQMPKWDPGFEKRIAEPPGPGLTAVGIDEDTALVGGPIKWTVMGRLSVVVIQGSTRTAYHAGETVTLPS
jgi:cyanophycinase